MNPFNFFGTPLYIGDGSLYETLKICVTSPHVIFHELSHFLVAKLCGCKVYEINIQFMHGHVIHEKLSDDSNICALITAAGHVGQTIIFTATISILTYIADKYGSFWAKFLCQCGWFMICGGNIGVFICCFTWLIFPNLYSDFGNLMKNKCYATILISKAIIGYCVYYSIRNCLNNVFF